MQTGEIILLTIIFAPIFALTIFAK